MYLVVTGAAPFQSLKVADIGDVPFAMYDINKAAADIRDAYRGYIKNGCKMLTMGGDHSITYPILQAVAVSLCCDIFHIMMTTMLVMDNDHRFDICHT